MRDLHDKLFEAACLILQNRAEKYGNRQEIGGDDFQGEVRTDFKHGYFGGISGIVFHADVDYNAEEGAHSGKVSFIVREGDAQHWLDVINTVGFTMVSVPTTGREEIIYGRPECN